MIKKLFKYGKITVVLTLIMALTLPSYATVGASDGSAFVTKAEFDAALSDFNARLTTFEAGINSKIDSQVSSYLDRNGIWNGQNVTVTGANMGPAAGKIVYSFSITEDLLASNALPYKAEDKFYRSYQAVDTSDKETRFERMILEHDNENKHWYPVYYTPSVLWKDWIVNTPKSGLLTGYLGYRFYANHMYKENQTSYNSTGWGPRFYNMSGEQKSFDTLMSMTNTSGQDSPGETLIMVDHAGVGPYQPGSIALDYEIYDTTTTTHILKYKINLYSWGLVKPAQSSLTTVLNGWSNNGWCQWSGGDYDPAPHSQFLTFFVQKDHTYQTKISIYSNGRNWDGTIGFADGARAGHITSVYYVNKDLSIY